MAFVLDYSLVFVLLLRPVTHKDIIAAAVPTDCDLINNALFNSSSHYVYTIEAIEKIVRTEFIALFSASRSIILK